MHLHILIKSVSLYFECIRPDQKTTRQPNIDQKPPRIQIWMHQTTQTSQNRPIRTSIVSLEV